MSGLFEGPYFTQVYEKLRDQPRLEHIPRRAALSRESFWEEVAPAGFPVLFPAPLSPEAALPSTEAYLALLQERHGDERLYVRQGDFGAPAAYASEKRVTPMTMGGFVAGLEAGETSGQYAGNQRCSAALLRSLGVALPPFDEPDRYERPALWLGPAGVVTPLHKDTTDNVIFQLAGRKRWLVFPVGDAPRLSMTRHAHRPGSELATSALDLRTLPLDGLEAERGVKAIAFEMAPGDALYLPMGWSHFVESLTLSLSINIWAKANGGPYVLRPS